VEAFGGFAAVVVDGCVIVAVFDEGNIWSEERCEGVDQSGIGDSALHERGIAVVKAIKLNGRAADTCGEPFLAIGFGEYEITELGSLAWVKDVKKTVVAL
jgi:hypothetical protein